MIGIKYVQRNRDQRKGMARRAKLQLEQIVEIAMLTRDARTPQRSQWPIACERYPSVGCARLLGSNGGTRKNLNPFRCLGIRVASTGCTRKCMRFATGDFKSRSFDVLGYLSVRKTSGGLALCDSKWRISDGHGPPDPEHKSSTRSEPHSSNRARSSCAIGS
jgi:hypothetical protein